MNKVILYIATSSDGFIADSEGRVDWLPHPKTSEDLEIVGYNRLMKRIGTIIMGRKSYQQIMTFGNWGWPDKHTYVLTSKPMESNFAYVEFTDDTPAQLLGRIWNQTDKDVWLLGGAKLIQSFAKANLIDELILTIVPQKLGSGIPLGLSLRAFHLVEETLLMDGIVQKTYLKNGP